MCPIPESADEIELEHIHRYLFALQFCQGRDVLDVACGDGYGSFLLSQVAHSVSGVAIDEDSVRHAIATYRGDGLSYRTGSFESVRAETSSADVVVSLEVLETVIEQERFMREIKRVLKPGGLLVMSTPLVSEVDFTTIVRRFFQFHALGYQKATTVSIIESRDPDRDGDTRNYFHQVSPLEFESAQQLVQSTHLVVVASDNPINRIHWGLLDDKDKQLSSNESNVARLSADLAALDCEVARLSSELTKRDDEISGLAQRLSTKDLEISRLSTRVAGLVGSLSWRITAPLRRVGPKYALASVDPLSVLLPERATRRLWARQIGRGGVFDAAFYLRSNPDVAAAGLDPLTHYIDSGAAEGRNPHPLFDTSYYLASNGDVKGARVNPLAHYVMRGATQRRAPHPLFDGLFYVESNPEVAATGANPVAHFWRIGAPEGRPGWSVQQAVRYLKPYVLHAETSGCFDYVRPEGEFPAVPRELKIALHTSSQGNYFFNEIGELVASGLALCGAEVVSLTELADRPSDVDVDMVVGPHEFFALGEGPKRLTDRWVSRAFMLNTEQLHTPWFAKSLPVLAHAPAVFDMNIQSAAGLRQMRIPAHFLPLGWLPNFAAFGLQEVMPDVAAVRSLASDVRNSVPPAAAPLTERPIDVLFVGTPSTRRRSFFARNAASLSKHQCFFLLGSNDEPLVQGRAPITTAAMVGLAQRSRILLNVHRDDFPYFEWHRIVCQGIWHKTLVVTEPCFRVPWLIPGQHYMECDSAALPEMIDWLLNAADGQATAESIREAAHEVLINRYSFDRILGAALSRVIYPSIRVGSEAKLAEVAQ